MQKSVNSATRYFLLGIGALLCLSELGGTIAFIAIFTIIGIPITLFIAFFPTFYLVFLISWILKHISRMAGKKLRTVYRLAISLAFLALIPFLVNSHYERQHQAYLSSDIRNFEKPAKMDSLAVIHAKSSRKKGIAICEGSCQRALLNGAVKKMIMYNSYMPHDNLDFSELEGDAYWLEQREHCPSPPLAKNGSSSGFRLDQKDINFGTRSPDDLIRLRASQGTCLITSKAKLSEADGIIVDGKIGSKKWRSPKGYNIFKDAAFVERRTFYAKKDDTFQIEYQNTAIRSSHLFPILAPTLQNGGYIKYSSGFLRRTKYLGNAKKRGQKETYSDFLQDKLGLQLVLNGSEFAQDIFEEVSKIAQSKRPLNEVENDLIRDFLDDRSWNEKIPEKDANLVLDLLKNPRIQIPNSTSFFIKKISKKSPHRGADFSAVLFDRLRTFEPDMSEKSARNQYKELTTISQTIVTLPKNSIGESDAATLVELSKDPIARVYADRALKRLGDNPANADALLFLIKDAKKYKGTKRKPGSKWESPYLAGLSGLCEMGKNGHKSEQIANQIKALIHDGTIEIKYRNYSNLAIKTLRAVGENVEQISDLFEAKFNEIKDDKQRQYRLENLERELKKKEERIVCQR